MSNCGPSAQATAVSENLRVLNRGGGGSPPPQQVVFGVTPRMLTVQKQIQGIKNTDLPVLIEGENGTGKEIIAYMIHVASRSSNRPFVKLNCSSMPASSIESELFGDEKGANGN